MDYALTHEKNDCYIALYLPAFWYEIKGRYAAKYKDDDLITARFIRYIEQYNSKVRLDTKEFLDSFINAMKHADSKLERYAEEKRNYFMSLDITNKDSEIHKENKHNEITLNNAGLFLAKTNEKLVNINTSVQYNASVLKGRVYAAEKYHSKRINRFIKGVHMSEPYFADKLKEIYDHSFYRAEKVYSEIIAVVRNNEIYIELQKHLNEYKNYYQ